MKFSEECGIFGGVSTNYPVAPLIQQGLFVLQHRGQESAGICAGDKDLYIYKNKGLVMEVLNDRVIKNIRGKLGIGHVRYSTQGGSDSTHAQPYAVNYLGEKVAVAHNGNVKSAVDMRKKLEKQGEVFLTTSDTEMLLKKVIRELCKTPSEWTFEEVGRILTENFTGGAWSILFFVPGKIFAYRDPHGYRPMSLCEAEEGVFVSSEDTSFQMLERHLVYHIEPGEGVEITRDGYEIKRFAPEMPSKKCVFEQIYFARPDSNVFGRNVYMSRVELGRKCAIENPVEADIVVPVMESGFAPALGFSQQSGIPLQMGLMRNRFVGRTFILPEQYMRQSSVRRKLTPIIDVVKDKRVIIIDDSIVRGTTSREIVRMLRQAGAKEVHFRSASPQIVNTCQWGVDIPTKKELIANKYEDVDGIREFIEADSLAYLSLEGLKEIFGHEGWCYSCLMHD
ncbi:MAG: amidophosphoribosyltransferase [Candidatus Melainabacteria bacterium GWF2_37_15]|nr:MAG: amidophosphoribosyltransferase [Candidatus Melainabacteria bacterium GWF2_37_15]